VAKVAGDIAAFKHLGRCRHLRIRDALQGAGPEFLAESRVDVLRPDGVPRMRSAGCTGSTSGSRA